MVSEEQGLILAGTEDNQIRLFDIKGGKQVKSFVAHTDSVTSLLLPPGGKKFPIFLSGGQDGAMRAWDLRTFHLLFDVAAHRRKFDEGLLTMAGSDRYPLLATGGGDSLIKIMHEAPQ